MPMNRNSEALARRVPVFYVRLQRFAADSNAFCDCLPVAEQNAPESDFSNHYTRS
jgi:hypothetical protein